MEYERLEEGTCPRPYWTEKQMKRRGEPQRKKMRRENPEEGNISGNKGVERGGPGELGEKTQSKGANVKEDGEGECMKQANGSNKKKPSQKELRKIKEGTGQGELRRE